MTSPDIDIDESLREQSKLLLRKLKDRQGKLQNIVNISSLSDKNGITASITPKASKGCVDSITNLKEKFDSSLEKTVDKGGKVGKEKLLSLNKTSKRDKDRVKLTRLDNNKENLDEIYGKKSMKSKEVNIRSKSPISRDTNFESSITAESLALNELKAEINGLESGTFDASETCAKRVETPNTVRRRKIIDKNVHVGGNANLNESEILRECEEDFPRLNFSYSNVDDTDLAYLQDKFSSETEPKVIDDEIPVRDIGLEETEVKGYSSRLENPGNSRKIAKFIRETGKPKSILLSTSQRQNKVIFSKIIYNLYQSCGVESHTSTILFTVSLRLLNLSRLMTKPTKTVRPV